MADMCKHNKQFLKHNTVFLRHDSIFVKQHKIVETIVFQELFVVFADMGHRRPAIN